MAFRSVCFIIAALWATTALAQAAGVVNVFEAVGSLPCGQLEQNLATLQSIDGEYSLVISRRAGQYQSMQAQLSHLQPVDVPYANQDLSPLPAATPALQPVTKRVAHQVADPNWVGGISSIALAGLFGAVAYRQYSTTPAGQQPNWTTIGSFGVLGALSLAGAVVAFTAFKKTVYVEQRDPAAAAANERAKEEAAQQNQQIDQKNATRKKELEQRQAAIAKNQKITDQRRALKAQMAAFEKQSKELVMARINSLDTESNRRCLDKLVYEGAAVRLGDQEAFVYLIIRPLNPAGAPLANAGQVRNLSFGVQSLTLADPLGQVTHVHQPHVSNVVSAADTPLHSSFPSGSVAMEFSVQLQSPVAVPGKLTVNADIRATQDGKSYDTHGQGPIRVVP